MMFGPLARISPSAAILMVTPGIAVPTVPSLGFWGGFSVSTGEVSVRPYPSRMGKEHAKKNRATSADRGALPEMKVLRRPPVAARTFLKTSLSAMACVIETPRGIFTPERRCVAQRSPAFLDQLKIACFTGLFDAPSITLA